MVHFSIRVLVRCAKGHAKSVINFVHHENDALLWDSRRIQTSRPHALLVVSCVHVSNRFYSFCPTSSVSKHLLRRKGSLALPPSLPMLSSPHLYRVHLVDEAVNVTVHEVRFEDHARSALYLSSQNTCSQMHITAC